MDCSPPGSSVHGISQTRLLEWVAILQGIFLIQGSNLLLLPWQVDILPLSHQGSPDESILSYLYIFRITGKEALTYLFYHPVIVGKAVLQHSRSSLPIQVWEPYLMFFFNQMSGSWLTLYHPLWESACNRGDMGSIPGLGRSPGERNVFQFSCLENSMDRGAWCTPIHGAAKSQIQLNNFHFNEKS